MMGSAGGEEEEKEEKKEEKEEEEENHTTSHSGSGPMFRWGLALLRSSGMSAAGKRPSRPRPPINDELAFSCINI